jgi:drug/metabolite transporter (DMT)-like permease
LLRPPENPRLAILLMVLSTVMFAVMWCFVKSLAATYPINEVTFFRSLFALIPASLMIATLGGRRALKVHRFAGHVWRSVIGVAAMMVGFLSYHLMPLANAIAISFAAPLIVTALSVPFLGEKVGVYRWSAVVVGFGGVLIIVHPSGDMFTAGALAAFAAAFGSAVSIVTIRQLNRHDAPVTIVFYYTLLCALLSGCTLPFAWVTPTAKDWLMCLIMGLIGGVGQYFMTRAFALAPAALVSPFNYTGLLFATFFGWALWDELPAPHVFIGAAVVVASGLFILYRETRRPDSLKPTEIPPST